MTGYLPGRCIQIWIASTVSRRFDDARREKWGRDRRLFSHTSDILHRQIFLPSRAPSRMRSTTKSTHVTAVIYRLRGHTPEIDRIYRKRQRRVAAINFFVSAIPLLIFPFTRTFDELRFASLFSSAPFVTAHVTETRKTFTHMI